MDTNSGKDLSVLKDLIRLKNKRYEGLRIVTEIRKHLRTEYSHKLPISSIDHDWKNLLINSLEEESRMLGVKLETDNPLRLKAEKQHKALLQMATSGLDHDQDALQDLADLLEENIRFEIRVLFPVIESRLNGNEQTTTTDRLVNEFSRTVENK